FLSNLMREIFSYLIIPYIALRLNYYTSIAPAGATSEDTTLPMMLKYTNEETVVLSVLNGMICSLFVPVIISLCL
ncbi:LysO family transporter, partial [uncultured Subdoligranulum sp.]|uniref:LysO family transporter n=1 Tax=uncultured Subdoligranulum sp. TaxID=512298 RepID=UPI00260170C0